MNAHHMQQLNNSFILICLQFLFNSVAHTDSLCRSFPWPLFPTFRLAQLSATAHCELLKNLKLIAAPAAPRIGSSAPSMAWLLGPGSDLAFDALAALAWCWLVFLYFVLCHNLHTRTARISCSKRDQPACWRWWSLAVIFFKFKPIRRKPLTAHRRRCPFVQSPLSTAHCPWPIAHSP